MVGTMPSASNGFSFEREWNLQNETGAIAKHRLAWFQEFIEARDAHAAALMTAATRRDIADWQAVNVTGERLRALMSGDDPSPSIINAAWAPENLHHEVQLESKRFQSWLNQASPAELAGLQASFEVVALTGGAPW